MSGDSGPEYRIDVNVPKTDEELSIDERRQILNTIANDVDGDAETSNSSTETLEPVSAGTIIGIGSIVVSSASLAVEVYKLLKEHSDVSEGSIYTNSEGSVFIEENAEVDRIEAAGGTVLHDEEGGVTIFQMTTEEVFELHELRADEDTDQD